MYNTEHICCYCDPNVFLESDIITKEDRDFILNCIYRNDLLYIFDVDDFNAGFCISGLYEKIKSNPFILSCIQEMATEYNKNEDLLFGLMVLYSFDFLDVMHPCVSEFLKTGEIKEQSMNLLREKVFAKKNKIEYK